MCIQCWKWQNPHRFQPPILKSWSRNTNHQTTEETKQKFWSSSYNTVYTTHTADVMRTTWLLVINIRPSMNQCIITLLKECTKSQMSSCSHTSASGHMTATKHDSFVCKYSEQIWSKNERPVQHPTQILGTELSRNVAATKIFFNIMWTKLTLTQLLNFLQSGGAIFRCHTLCTVQ